MKLRTWAWFRLYQKVKPLLNATKIEDELKVSSIDFASSSLFQTFGITVKSSYLYGILNKVESSMVQLVSYFLLDKLS